MKKTSRDWKGHQTRAAMPEVEDPRCPKCNASQITANLGGGWNCSGCDAWFGQIYVADNRGGVYSQPRTIKDAKRQAAEARKFGMGGEIVIR